MKLMDVASPYQRVQRNAARSIMVRSTFLGNPSSSDTHRVAWEPLFSLLCMCAAVSDREP